MTANTDGGSRLRIPGVTTRHLEPRRPGDARLRYLEGGAGPTVLLLHTVRTQAEHFRHVIPLLLPHRRVLALDLPGMGHSEIVPGACYDEPALRAAVVRLLTELDLTDLTLVGESLGAVLALTAAAGQPDRVRAVVAVNAYDYPGGLARSGVLARVVMSGIALPVLGRAVAHLEPRPVMRTILRGGLHDRSSLREDYLDELLAVGRRPGYAAVARGIYRSLPSLIRARSRYGLVTAPVSLVYGTDDWSRTSDRTANATEIPHATLRTIGHAAHFMSLERPDVVADAVLSLH